MDPITALAAATAIWSGIKATVDAGREVQDVFGQLGAWAEQANKVYEVINHREGKPSIFSIIKYEKSETRHLAWRLRGMPKKPLISTLPK